MTPVFPCNIVYVLYLLVSYRIFEEKKLFYSLYKHLIKKMALCSMRWYVEGFTG
jgi:hypothetical protein